MQNNVVLPKHVVTMTDCGKLSASGVKEVVNFDESAVTLITSCGTMTIEGEGLRMASLDPVKGTTEVTGHVTGVFYSKAKEKGFGFFKRGK